MQNVFPEYCVKQVLAEHNLERGDEQIIYLLQNQLLPRVLLDIVKGATHSAIIGKRKNINDLDIEHSLMLARFKASATVSKNRILDSKLFQSAVNDVLQYHLNFLKKHNIEVKDAPKLSSSSIVTLQNVCESCIRTFVSKLTPFFQRYVNNNSFDMLMFDTLGFISNEGYITVS
jgi:histone H3/H4